MTTHRLKTWPDPFAAVLNGTKSYEIRVNDRDYQMGDILHLVEFFPEDGMFTGDQLWVRVTYMTKGGDWGLPDHLCVMSIEPVGSEDDEPA
ncbi:MAG: DUF3850 domain-containing protein [Gemmatimonadales bacterium]|nr:MAG: DUF3850 domain-containing protein [Gemmatimonadales bacterium]